jgi:hypothetical protein
VKHERDESETLWGETLRHDRELIGLAEAAALAGVTRAVFWFEANRHHDGRPCGLWPAWNGFPEVNKQYIVDARGKWVRYPRWRRGEVLAAVARNNQGSPLLKD